MFDEELFETVVDVLDGNFVGNGADNVEGRAGFGDGAFRFAALDFDDLAVAEVDGECISKGDGAAEGGGVKDLLAKP